jgi:preprotein translocase subunit SecB
MTSGAAPDALAAGKRSKDLELLVVRFASIEAHPVVGRPAEPPTKRLGWELREVDATWTPIQENDVLVLLPMKLGISSSAEKSLPLAFVSVTFGLVYRLKGEPWSDAEISNALGVMGYLHVWPYFRAEVQVLTAKLGFPALTLPVAVSGHAERFVRIAKLVDAPADAEDNEAPKETSARRGKRKVKAAK